jgi:hypothetical protein
MHLSQKSKDWLAISTVAILLAGCAYFASVTEAQNRAFQRQAIEQSRQNGLVIGAIHTELAERAIAISNRFCALGKIWLIHMPDDPEVGRLVAEVCRPPKP